MSSIWQLIKLMIKPPKFEDPYIYENCPELEGAIIITDKKPYGYTSFYCVGAQRRYIISPTSLHHEGYIISGFKISNPSMPDVYNAYSTTNAKIKVDLHEIFANSTRFESFYINDSCIKVLLHPYVHTKDDDFIIKKMKHYVITLYDAAVASDITYIYKQFIDITLGTLTFKCIYSIEPTPNGKQLFDELSN